jgi:hypothetical protein
MLIDSLDFVQTCFVVLYVAIVCWKRICVLYLLDVAVYVPPLDQAYQMCS